MDAVLEIIKDTELEYQCYECGHIESTLFKLSQHIKKEHPDPEVAIQATQHIYIVRKLLKIKTAHRRILLEELLAVMP